MGNAERSGRWVVDLPEGTYHEYRDMNSAAQVPLEIARSLADLSHRLYARNTTEDVIDTILDYAVAGLTGCDHAGISLAHKAGRIETPASTDKRAMRLDELQYQLREGPCVHAIWEQRSFNVVDLATDARWPQYGPAAAEHGAGSMLAYRLYTEERTVGALNLYSLRVNGFTDLDEQLALLLAAHAAVAIDAARTRSQLREAIDGRQVIGEAIGILKERHRVTSQQAFDQLAATSQHLNVKLREIARHITDTGEESTHTSL